jgi:hypothetical protein
MANLLIYTSAVKVGWGIAVVALLVVFVLALKAWWSELREVEKLSSEVSPNWKQFKR